MTSKLLNSLSLTGNYYKSTLSKTEDQLNFILLLPTNYDVAWTFYQIDSRQLQIG